MFHKHTSKMTKKETEVSVATGERNLSLDRNNNCESSSHNDFQTHNPSDGSSTDKYQLRPRSLRPPRRIEAPWNLQDTMRNKSRPQPLSRYRRKTANARERFRMRQINSAFESLRRVLPSWVCNRRPAADLTKITTLRLASAYIRSLQDILEGNTPEDICFWALSPQETCTWGLPSVQQEAFHADTTSGTPQLHPQSTLPPLLHTPDSGGLQESPESCSYLSAKSESQGVALLLGAETSPCWDDRHAPLVW